MTDLSLTDTAGFRTKEARLLRHVMAELLGALPRCSKCDEVATCKGPRFHFLCDAHAPKSKHHKVRQLAWAVKAKQAASFVFVLDCVEGRKR